MCLICFGFATPWDKGEIEGEREEESGLASRLPNASVLTMYEAISPSRCARAAVQRGKSECSWVVNISVGILNLCPILVYDDC